MRRIRVLAFLWIALGGTLALPAIGHADGQADYSRTPVLMIHGYFVVDQAGTFTWSTFKKKMVADGWPEEYIWTPSFDNVRGCNEDHVEEIEAWVEALRKKEKVDKIDIVCHSFGCLNTVTWLKQRCGMHRVRQFVGLAGAVHGTRVACAEPFSCAASQMCIPLFGEDSWKESAFLVDIHGCDETPGDVMYTSVWSEYDEIIRPPSGSILAGARNIEVDTKWVEHAGIFMCDECYLHVKEALLGAGGLNEDGPGWECVPEACRPLEPEPVPEDPDVPEPVVETPPEPMPDAAVTPPDAGSPDLAEADAPVPDVPAPQDRGMETESADESGGIDTTPADDPGTVVPPRKGGGCSAGGPSVGWAALMVGIALLVGARRRRA